MDPMFAQGLELMLIGMGVVFAFLVLLVWMIGLMSRLVNRLAPAPGPDVAKTAAAPAPAMDGNTLAVIREAIRRHRAAGR